MAVTTRLRSIGAAALALLIGAFFVWQWWHRVDAQSYFPLDVGHRWQYALRYEGEDAPPDEVLNINVDRVVSLANRQVAVRRDALGVDYYIADDETGLYRIAKKIDTDDAPTLDAAPRYVLKKPFVVGTEWSAETLPYLIKRKSEFPRELRYTHKATMSYRIEATNETVTVPAGTFQRCLKVTGTALLRLYTDPVNGFNDVPLISIEWYCQGVGLVKFERSEKLRSGFMTGGAVVAELVN